MSDHSSEAKEYRIGSTGLVNGPGMMKNFKHMWETGDERIAIQLMAACFPDLPIGLCYDWLTGARLGSYIKVEGEVTLVLEY